MLVWASHADDWNLCVCAWGRGVIAVPKGDLHILSFLQVPFIISNNGKGGDDGRS